jgi:hypothetical protein
MLMAGEAYLAALRPDDAVEEDAIREAIAGNLGRCTDYTKIIDAIALAAERRARPELMPPPPEPPVDRPRSLAEAYQPLTDGAGPPRPIAGGTDLMVQLTGELVEPLAGWSICGASMSCAESGAMATRWSWVR